MNLSSRLKTQSEAVILHFLELLVRDKSILDPDLAPDRRFNDLADQPMYENDENELVETPGDILNALNENQTPSEQVLLKDLPYTLQGLVTESFDWLSPKQLMLPDTLRMPYIALLNELLEPALLFKAIKAFVDSESPGLVRQAMQSGIQQELEAYQALIGVIESQVRRSVSHASGSKPGSSSQMTLIRTFVLLHEPTLGLRLLYSLIQETEDRVGGQIISQVHGYTYHGDQLVSNFAKRLLPQLTKPFYRMVNQWINTGTLQDDPHGEFFVYIADEKSAWHGRFGYYPSKVPSIMSEELALQVLHTGKTVYFIRVLCQDQWEGEKPRTNDSSEDSVEISHIINLAYSRAVNHLNNLLESKFHLHLHLQGLKNYLLLAKGDFVQHLMENAAPFLDRPASRLFRHHLTSTLESAVQGSNARFDHPDILQSLDARMLESGHGDIGWDVFTLDYHVEHPLDVVILDRLALNKYLQVFNMLWRLKRIAYSLNQSWRRIATEERRGLFEKTKQQWKMVQAICAQMVHFISELQYYLSYEVIEMSWAKLQSSLGWEKQQTKESPQRTVDQIIEAHMSYLESIVFKALLGGGPSLMGGLHDILKLCLRFRDGVDGLYELSIRISSSEDQTEPEIQKRMDVVIDRMTDIRAQFEASVKRLVVELTDQEDNEMKFLAVRLNYNEFYGL